MPVYLEIIIYFIALSLSFTAFAQLDFHSFMRKSKIQLSVFVYIVFSLAVGFMIGFGFVELLNLFNNLF